MDKTLRDSLEVLFHKTSPKRVIQNFLNPNQKDYFYKNAYDEKFENRMKDVYSFLSSDEISNIASALSECTDNFGGNENFKNCGIFKPVFKFAEETLSENGGQPVIKYDQLLRFRDATHSIGADIFVCAFLAHVDFKKQNKRRNFDYSNSLSTDNIRLQNILKQGMAENHFHIKGSTPAFLLSWVCLMNNIN